MNTTPCVVFASRILYTRDPGVRWQGGILKALIRQILVIQ